MGNSSTIKVLISPLSWGLGHAARCIPVINEFIKQSCEVHVLANTELISYLKHHFPDINYIEDNFPCIEYGIKGFNIISLICAGLKISKRYRKEQTDINILLEKQHFDVIVSDNRYGIWNKHTYNILITHQIQPILNGSLQLFQKMISRYINKKCENFDEIWIPDLKKVSLSGRLSKKIKGSCINTKRIGILSRFLGERIEEQPTEDYYLILSSGPLTHRKEMTDYFIHAFENSDKKLKIIGVSDTPFVSPNIEIYENPEDKVVKKLVAEAACIISRSGYSTIMDLIALGKSAILIPTHGQSEQEYLSKYLQKYFVYAPSLQQAVHFINVHIKILKPQIIETESFLEKTIKEVIDKKNNIYK